MTYIQHLIESILADLESQEVGVHPTLYSPDQVRKTLTRYLSPVGSMKVERSPNETRTPRNESSN